MLADSPKPAAAAALREAGRVTFTDALRAAQIGIGLSWFLTGAVSARSDRC